MKKYYVVAALIALAVPVLTEAQGGRGAGGRAGAPVTNVPAPG